MAAQATKAHPQAPPRAHPPPKPGPPKPGPPKPGPPKPGPPPPCQWPGPCPCTCHKSVVSSNAGKLASALCFTMGPLHVRVKRVVAFWAAHQALKTFARADNVCSTMASSAVKLRAGSARVHAHSSVARAHTHANCGGAPAPETGSAAGTAGATACPRSAGAGLSAPAAAHIKTHASGRRAMAARTWVGWTNDKQNLGAASPAVFALGLE